MRLPLIVAAACALVFSVSGCTRAPGYPTEEALRPQDQLDFHVLYSQNCSGCHGAKGQNGAAIDLANPEYQALVDDATMKKWIIGGMPGTEMSAFGASAGGMLTDTQINALVAGMRKEWSKPDVFGGQTPPQYAQDKAGDAAHGHAVYMTACASCHQQAKQQITDANYLALVSDQALRSIVIAGRPDIGHPDWRNDVPGKPLSAQDVTDVVTYLDSLRSQAEAK
ncbi:c-type cytochrome [Paracidobacterium acidisoli]|nr:c-type cytochrome [Paracidobacterium acidisoli]